METPPKPRTTLTKIREAWRLLSRSRRALLGLFIIILYTSLAAGAPILAQNDPVQDLFVAGDYAQPGWYFAIGRGGALSGNLGLFPDLRKAEFSADASLADWAFESESPAFSIGRSATVGQAAPGSIEIRVSRPTVGTKYELISLNTTKTFEFPYTGYPARFLGSVYTRLQVNSGTPGIIVTAFLERVGEASFAVWRGQYLIPSQYPTGWVPADPPIDSFDARERITYFSQYAPAGDPLQVFPERVVFSKPGLYAVRIQVEVRDFDETLPLDATIFLDDINLVLLGTAYGILGTDHQGRDLFSQLLHGARISLLVGLLAALLSIVIGLLVGVIAGYRVGLVDEFLMRFTDMLLVVPFLPLLLVLIAVLGASVWNVIGVISLLGWMGFARVVRSQVVSLRERPFVEASRALGGGSSHVVRKHILPNVMGLVYVSLALGVPGAILTEAALSFLGLFDPTVMSWGRMLFNAETYGGFRELWWILPPGFSIALLSLAFILIGYALDDVLNPKLRQRR